MKALFKGSGAERKNALRSAAIFLAVTLLCGGFSLFLVDNFSVLSRVDQFVQDWEIAGSFARPEAYDPDIVIVAVDEPTTNDGPVMPIGLTDSMPHEVVVPMPTRSLER